MTFPDGTDDPCADIAARPEYNEGPADPTWVCITDVGNVRLLHDVLTEEYHVEVTDMGAKVNVFHFALYQGGAISAYEVRPAALPFTFPVDVGEELLRFETLGGYSIVTWNNETVPPENIRYRWSYPEVEERDESEPWLDIDLTLGEKSYNFTGTHKSPYEGLGYVVAPFTVTGEDFSLHHSLKQSINGVIGTAVQPNVPRCGWG